jgi:hypothetical protein
MNVLTVLLLTLGSLRHVPDADSACRVHRGGWGGGGTLHMIHPSADALRGGVAEECIARRIAEKLSSW